MPDLRLAIELSTRTGSVALARGGRCEQRTLERARAHASDLLPAVDALARDLGVEGDVGSRLDAVLVGTGPGSYTGLRVALATALGLARGSGAKLRGVPSFDVLVYGALAPGEEGFVAIDAHAGACYVGHYRRDADDVVALAPPEAASVTSLRERVGALRPRTRLLLGAELAASLALDDVSLVQTDVTPRAAALLELGGRRLAALGPEEPARLEPLYLRAFGERPD